MKKSYLLLSIIALLSIGTLSSCRRFRCVHGSGKVISKSQKMPDFSKIDISGGFKVKLVQDSSLNVTIKMDDNLFKYINTDVEGDKLVIKSRRNLCASGEIMIVIGVKNLEEVDASGAIDVSSSGRIVTKDLHFDLSGSTSIDMDIAAANVHTEGSGSTDMILKGQAASHNVDMSGSSKIDAFDFVVGKYNIETSGASEAKINVLNSLSVHSSGASDIEYRGTPGNVNIDKSGASSVKKVN
ncbi:head GIN domain-containing protein [Mucilaginibacter glaciei]|uniref:DUF2807 domain-containing protein n=1 Tax=Mucilaginibacter glaciei TaxID=2772109 RepID=A0A926NMS5_9SPHI|nr:head GIN domain-containing protein [Mucilaginibacter glaciei]MBD1394964.1 DUF2807 domain-containing protein [Mucilaginibacter glaciei]